MVANGVRCPVKGASYNDFCLTQTNVRTNGSGPNVFLRDSIIITKCLWPISDRIKPLNPNINMHILITVPHFFSTVIIVGRSDKTSRHFVCLVIISFILITCMFGQVVIL